MDGTRREPYSSGTLPRPRKPATDAVIPHSRDLPPPGPFPRAPSRAERLALRVLQLGALAVVLAASTYKAFELDRFFVPKEGVLHLTALLAGLLTLGAARRTRAGRTDALLLGFLVLGGASALFAANPWAALRALAISVSGVTVFWAARAVARAGLARPLLAAVALAAAVGAGTALLQAYGVRTELFSLNRAPGGTLGNRNFVAHLAAFGFPVLLLAALRAYRPAGFLVAAAGLATASGALFLTRSRAAWLAVAVVALVLVVGVPLVPPLRRHRRTLGRLLALLLVAGGGVAAVLVLPNTLRWRSENPYLESARGLVNYEEGSGRGRLIQYRTSARMALGDPLLGVGPGNWPVAYPAHAGRRDPSLSGTDAGTTSNPWPSSDWVAFLAERGIPAFLLLVGAFLALAAGAWRRMRSARDADEGLVALTLVATLAAVAVVGAFDAVLLLALPSLLVWAALGALQAAHEPGASAPGRGGSGARVLVLLVVSLAAGAGAAKSAGQLAAMALYAQGGRESLERAARLDPGSYRIHLRLARTGGRASRCEHARKAHALFPEAEAARRLARRCD
jgi:O-antigen ligase